MSNPALIALPNLGWSMGINEEATEGPKLGLLYRADPRPPVLGHICASWPGSGVTLSCGTHLSGLPLSPPARRESRPGSDRSRGSPSLDLHRRGRVFLWLLASPLRGPGIGLQPEDVAGNVFSDVGIELAYIPFGGGREFHAVGQGISLRVLASSPGARCFLRVRRGRRGRLRCPGDPFLACQTLQQAEILNRDDGCQVFPTAGNDGALFPVGRAVHEIGKLFPRF
jgi:hypothetical protein